MAGLAVLAMLVAAPAATASTVSLRDQVVVYEGDTAADAVQLTRFVDTRGNSNPNDDIPYYLVSDNAQLTFGNGCARVSATLAACRVTAGLKRYDLRTGGGDDTLEIAGDTAGGSADLGAGNDRFTGLAAGDAVHGGDGDDIVKGGAGNDALFGDDGADQLGGEAGNDALDGGTGDDQLEFGGPAMAAGAGAGADDLRGGPGADRLSYNDHSSAVQVTLDEQAGDGGAGEGDNEHGDVETIVGSTFDDVLVGSDGGQELFGHAGDDRVDGLGGTDIVNGGTGDDELYGGAGDDRVEGSAGEDYLEGGAGEDLFEGDNVCSAEPCTGGSDFIQARDGEPDTVNCGVGADTAIVDAVDAVATDSQHGCERIDRAAAPAGTTFAPPAPGAVLGESTSGPKVRVIGVRKLSTLRRGKLRVEVTCPASCRVKARLISGRTVVASVTRTRLGAGVQTVRPKTSAKGRRLLKRRTKVVMTLVVDVLDDQRVTTTLTRVLRFRR